MFEAFLTGVCSLLIIGVLILVGWLCLDGYQQSQTPTFELHKNEWVCTKSHNDIITTFISTGKTMMPIITSVTVCDEYTRRK